MDQRIACIGSGMIGRSWAVAFAAGGCRVDVYDQQTKTLETAQNFCEEALDALAEYDLCKDPKDALSRITFCETLKETVVSADYIQENIAENLDLKHELFAQIDELAPSSAVVASSTSTFPPSELFEKVAGRSRCLVAHPMNPPHLLQTVELCPSPWTDQAVLDTSHALLVAVGREPIVVKKEIRGFVVNRLQLALIGEALHLVSEGYCSASDIDKAMRESLGLRWTLFGPFYGGHLNSDGGYGEYMGKFEKTLRALIKDLHVDYEWTTEVCYEIAAEMDQVHPSPSAMEALNKRDRQLMALTKALSSS